MAQTSTQAHSTPLLDVRNLTVEFRGRDRWLPIVEDMSFTVMPGEILGVVGESGCGKTTLALAALRLLPQDDTVRVSGAVLFDGTDLLQAPPRRLREFRGTRIAMIPQDPMSSLNPLLRIGAQVEEAVTAHGESRSAATRRKVIDLLQGVRINKPEARARQYPHELSGGLRQRAIGAIATAADPELLIADEPTTALDVTVQSRYLQMLRDLQRQKNLAIIFITHDLGVVASLCDRVLVMYAGRKVEEGDVGDVFANPGHWYTRALLDSVPALDRDAERLRTIPGQPPRPGGHVAGCRFAPRCPHAQERCEREEPELDVAGRSVARCWYPPSAENANG